MIRRKKSLCVLLMSLLCAFIPAHALAATDRAEVETRVRADVLKDLETPWQPESLAGRSCLDGRPVADFSGDVVEYRVNLECSYCGIVEPIQAHTSKNSTLSTS